MGSSREKRVGRGLQDSPPRSCTDIGFIAVFACFWIAVLFIAGWCLENGDPYLLVYGADSWGNICGRDGNVAVDGVPNSGLDMTSRPHQVYTVGPDGVPDTQKIIICAHSCPTDYRLCQSSAEKMYCRDVLGVCVSSFPYSLPEGDINSTCNEFVNPDSENEGCPLELSATTKASVFNRCIPDSGSGAAATAVYNTARNSYSELETLLESLEAALPIIQYCFVIALIMAYLVIVLMQYFIRPLVWAIIIGLIVVLCWACYYLYNRYKFLDDDISQQEALGIPISDSETQDRDFYFYVFIISTIATIILVLVIIALRRAIMKATLIYKEASKVAFRVATMFLSPFITWAFLLLWLVFWIAVMAHLVTSDELVAQGNCTLGEGYGHVKYIARENYNSFFWFYVLALFWVFEFILACEQLTLAGCVVSYYVTSGHPPRLIWLRSIWRVVRYHLGSAIFGSLIIAIVQVMRIALEYVNKHVQGEKIGAVGKFVICCCRCCLWCLKTILKFVSKRAMVEIMLFGLDFCNGCFQATGTLLKNILTVGAMNFVGAFLQFLIKVLVSTGTTLIAFYWIQGEKDIENQAVVLVVIALISWITAAAFVDVYGMIADSLLICFCEDSSQAGGAKFAPKALMNMIHHNAAVKSNSVSPGGGEISGGTV